MVIVWIIQGVILLALGVTALIYSPWSQNYIRERLTQKLNEHPGLTFQFDDLRLRFPLRLDLQGVMLAQDGDTLIHAQHLNADVKLLPLISGNVVIRKAALADAYYRMGSPDSSMYMTIRAKSLLIRPATIDLKTLDICLDDANISHAIIDMTLRPDTTPSDTSASTPMKIMLKHLQLDDFTYKMSMLPTIDSLGTTIGHGTLLNGEIDLGKQTLKLQSIIGDSLSATYIAPDAATAAAYPTTPDDPNAPPSEPWTINIDTISFTGSNALYTTRGYRPTPGLDFGYIQANNMDLAIHGFYNQASTLRMPLTLHATERCGLTLNATGEFALNETEMLIRQLNVTTDATYLDVDALMGMGDMTTDPNLPLRLKVNGFAGFSDISTMFPGYKYYLSLFPRAGRADVKVDINGTPSQLRVDLIDLAIRGCADLRAHGSVQHIFSDDRIGGDIALSGHIINIKSILNAFVEPSMGLTVPPMTLNGNVSYHPGITKGQLTATTLGGKIALNANYNSRAEGYAIDLSANDFPINAFMADIGAGRATLDLKAEGQGFDIFKPSTHLDVDANVHSLVYGGYDYRNIDCNAHILNGEAAITANSASEALNASLNASGNLNGDTYNWDIALDGENIDLFALKFAEEPASVKLSLQGNASVKSNFNEFTADIDLNQLEYISEIEDINITNVTARVECADSITSFDLHNLDLSAQAYMPYHYSKIVDNFTKATDLAMVQLKERKIDVDTIQKVLPTFNISLICGNNNLLTELLETNDMRLDHLSLQAQNDSSLYFCSQIYGFETGTTRLDSIDVDLIQQAEKMHIVGKVNNRPGTLDNWAHLTVDGMVNGDKVSLRLTQQDIDMVTGFDIGAITSLADSTITSRIFPLTPVIGYKKWTVNLDNFLRFNFYTHQVDANLKMKGDKSSLQLYSQHPTDSVSDSVINDIVLKVGDINLADWLSFNPFAPPISGSLSADMKVRWDGGSNVNGSGNLSLADFYYDKRKVAALDLDMNVETNLSGTIRATADLMVDGKRTMKLSGNLNDSISGSPFNLDFTLIQFPLNTANPFLPADVAQLTGTLNGNMMISGDADNPLINGEIFFTDAAVKVAMTNTAYKFSEVKIPVKDNVVKFTDFNIRGLNENPLYVNGLVDLRTLSSPSVDLDFKAKNLMLVNSNRASKNAIIYGKAYVDLNATAQGNMRLLDLYADLTLLSGSNVTYVMTDETTDISSSADEGMVKFVNLNDTAAVAMADSISENEMLLNIEAQVNIQSGTTVNVDLNTGSRNKVMIQPQGSLTYTQTPMSTEGRMVGRINLNNGYVRYTLPVIGSEKAFNVNSGSYVSFTGDILNPTLNLHATDPVKINVTQDGNARMVNFDILVGITGTLSRMDVAFDLSTNDDLSIANELQSMSTEQRASQAMNMLLYNMYTGPGSSSNINLSANPLFSFLESQINNWAAQNIRGVDLSFGIDQFNQTTNGTTSTAMSYSYQMSKSLFNDRFKIVIGGNYTTDNNADENIAENLINDISFEYFLNSQQTMLLKLFRHMGYESILEGEITQTGVGFVYRRKMEHLNQMLPKFLRPRQNSQK